MLQLASKSPRRRELLDQMGVVYQVVSAAIDETVTPQETPDQAVVRLAEAKARAGFVAHPKHPTLGSDTLVVCDDEVLGKPKDEQAAKAMLARLSGRTHQVMTGVALVSAHKAASRLSISEVRFRAISVQEINAYWDSGEPADKAGAYAIQGLAAIFVAHLSGSYSGVMGLPIYETWQLLAEFGLTRGNSS